MSLMQYKMTCACHARPGLTSSCGLQKLSQVSGSADQLQMLRPAMQPGIQMRVLTRFMSCSTAASRMRQRSAYHWRRTQCQGPCFTTPCSFACLSHTRQSSRPTCRLASCALSKRILRSLLLQSASRGCNGTSQTALPIVSSASVTHITRETRKRVLEVVLNIDGRKPFRVSRAN